jgi:hypothetical protein
VTTPTIMSSLPLYGSGRQSASFGAQRFSSIVYCSFGTTALVDGVGSGGTADGAGELAAPPGGRVLTAGVARDAPLRARSESHDTCEPQQPKAKSVAKDIGRGRRRCWPEKKKRIALTQPVSRNRRQRAMLAFQLSSGGRSERRLAVGPRRGAIRAKFVCSETPCGSACLRSRLYVRWRRTLRQPCKARRDSCQACLPPLERKFLRRELTLWKALAARRREGSTHALLPHGKRRQGRAPSATRAYRTRPKPPRSAQ